MFIKNNCLFIFVRFYGSSEVYTILMTLLWGILIELSYQTFLYAAKNS